MTDLHRLFNELHKALVDEGDREDKPILYGIAKQVDAAHHDYANIELKEGA